MAKAKKKTVSEAAPKKDPFDFGQIDGFGFRWVNAEVRQRNGWGIWSPVTVESELGQKVKEMFESAMVGVSMGLHETDSNYFFRAASTMLACAPVEAIEAHREEMRDKANARLREVHNTKGAKLRSTYIQKAAG